MTHATDELTLSKTNDPPLESQPIQQVGFMAALSGDAIFEIFAYLGQQDCLTTMAVCRYWYYSIPRFIQKSWTTLQLSPGHIGNQRLYSCLGKHVKHVTFEKFKNEQELYTIMRELVEHDCTGIKSLEFNRCRTAADQEVFVRMTQKLSTHVTHLKMMRHGSNVSFLHVLNACPQLTHFIYQADQEWQDTYRAEPIDIDPSIHYHFPTITHLCLDAVLHRQTRLDPILRGCPNLRYFAGANLRRKRSSHNIEYHTLSVDFDLLFQWCPRIAYIENTFGYSFIPNIDNIVMDNAGGLRHLSICQVYQPDAVVQHLTNSQHTLEFLSIRRHGRNSDGIDWLSVLRPVQLSRLHTLVFGNLGLRAEAIVVVINNCPALEKLVLYAGLTFNRLAIRGLEPCRQLRTLSLREISLTSDVSLMRFLDNFPALEKLAMFRSTIPLVLPEGYQSPRHLKELDLRHIEWIHDDEDISIKEAIVKWFQCFATHSNIQAITLFQLPNFDIQSLPSIASIPTLKSLTIQVNEAQCTATEEDGLCQFASLLKASVIEELYMETWWHLPESILDRLRELPRLRTHHVSHRICALPCTHCSIPRRSIRI